jgi:hypothetical protein
MSERSEISGSQDHYFLRYELHGSYLWHERYGLYYKTTGKNQKQQSPRPPCPPTPPSPAVGVHPALRPALRSRDLRVEGKRSQLRKKLSLSPCGRLNVVKPIGLSGAKSVGGIKGEGDSGSSHPRAITKNQNPVSPGFWFSLSTDCFVPLRVLANGSLERGALTPLHKRSRVRVHPEGIHPEGHLD